MMVLALLLGAWSALAAPPDDGWKAYGKGDFGKARALCQAPADAGDAACQVLIGNLYLKGEGVQLDYAAAERYFRKAAGQGNSGGEQALGWLHQNGLGVKRDLSLALKWYRKAAEKGDAWGQTGLGGLYYHGLGVAQDYAESAKWWRKAAEQGHAEAQQGLAWQLHNGWGVKKDDAEAFLWAKRSADQNNHWGQNVLAYFYFNGFGVKKDDAEAARLWRLSAEQGNVYAPNGLGFLLREGRGVRKDHKEALKWFRAGIERGELAHCTMNLGVMYENGQGVTQDYVEAYKWHLISSAHDSPYAQPGIDRLKALMTKEQIAEAQKLAKAFETAGRAAAEPLPASPTASAPSSPVDAPGYKRPERPDDFALVVGVESYSLKDLPSARFAERDADAFAAHALALGVPARNLKVLKGSDATAGKLRGYLESWLPKNVKPGSRVYFYFSGHGAPNPQSGDAYLLPWDGDPAVLKETAASLKDVYASLGRLKAAQVVVALDACFSGAGARSVIQKGTRPLVNVRDQGPLPAQLAVLAAAESDQTTGTAEAEGHGLFTYYLLEGLGQGRKSARELCGYLKPKVADAAARDNRSQSPVCRGADAAF